MRYAAAIFVLLAIGHAEIIDRVAVSIEKSVITESEILRQIRITALLNDEEPDFSGSNKRETADRLIEQALIRREMQVSRFPLEVERAAAERYDEFRKRFPDEAAYQRKLSEYKLTDEDVRSALRWQTTLLRFIAVRFRPGIQIPEEEIRAYYDTQIRPVMEGQPEGRVSFEDARDRIEAILMAAYVDNAVDRWLGQVRTQNQIRYKEDAFR